MSSQPSLVPPLDPELRPLLDAEQKGLPRLSLDVLASRRRRSAQGRPGVTPPDLTAGGRISVEDVHVPGPPGAPDLTLAVLRRTDGSGAGSPALYHLHGGGMVLGDRRGGLEELL